MKSKRSLITLMVVAIATIASAAEKPKTSVQPLNSNQIHVSILNNKVSNFEIIIRAQNGEIVYYKQTEEPVSSYQKIFDFKNLKNGDYSMRFKIDGTNLDREFTVTSRKIYIGESELSFDPYFVFDGKELKFSYLNLKQKKYNMEIFNNNEVVYQTSIGDDFAIHSGYDIGKLKPGHYTLMLSSFDEEFTYHFEK